MSPHFDGQRTVLTEIVKLFANRNDEIFDVIERDASVVLNLSAVSFIVDQRRYDH